MHVVPSALLPLRKESDRLYEALRRAIETGDHAAPQLREAVSEYVTRGRRRVRTPDDIVSAVKAHLRRAARLLDTAAYQRLSDRVLVMTLNEYYNGR
ncbi:MAG: hypothetical protein ACREON_15370 [Gemmatimonadaceae bacterium]